MAFESGLSGKVAIVTGGSRGIGRAIVELLAGQGANVTFFYRGNEAAANEVVAGVQAAGVFNVTRPVIPYMMSQRAGRIVNLSSVAGNKAGRGQANYAASKGAVDALTRALAVELAPRKILVNAVAPGVIETEMSQQVRDLAEDEVKRNILLKRYGQAQDVANAVGFLVSDLASYVTGQVLYVDGGFKMG